MSGKEVKRLIACRAEISENPWNGQLHYPNADSNE